MATSHDWLDCGGCLDNGCCRHWLRVLDEEAKHELYPPPRKWFCTGSHRLHMHSVGEGKSTVIFDSGAGGEIGHKEIVKRAFELTEVEWYERARQNVGEMSHIMHQLGDALKNGRVRSRRRLRAARMVRQLRRHAVDLGTYSKNCGPSRNATRPSGF